MQNKSEQMVQSAFCLISTPLVSLITDGTEKKKIGVRMSGLEIGVCDRIKTERRRWCCWSKVGQRKWRRFSSLFCIIIKKSWKKNELRNLELTRRDEGGKVCIYDNKQAFGLFNDVWVERENLSIKIGLDFQTDSTAREIEKGLLEIIWKFGGGTCQKGLTDKPVTDFLF